jgi:hypothetical protein
LLERLLGYLGGLTLWCLVLGPVNRLGRDLTTLGELGLVAGLLAALALAWIHWRRRRGPELVGPPDPARTATGVRAT